MQRSSSFSAAGNNGYACHEMKRAPFASATDPCTRHTIPLKRFFEDAPVIREVEVTLPRAGQGMYTGRWESLDIPKLLAVQVEASAEPGS
jgi:hypothetical protein